MSENDTEVLRALANFVPASELHAMAHYQYNAWISTFDRAGAAGALQLANTYAEVAERSLELNTDYLSLRVTPYAQ